MSLGDFIVIAIVAAVVAFVIVKMIKDKKAGKSSCSCNCGCCPNSALCHSQKKPAAKEHIQHSS